MSCETPTNDSCQKCSAPHAQGFPRSRYNDKHFSKKLLGKFLHVWDAPAVSIQSGAAYELLTALTAQRQNTDVALDCCPTVPYRSRTAVIL